MRKLAISVPEPIDLRYFILAQILLSASMTPDQKRQITKDAWQRGLERLRPLVYQHRVGHFRVDCRVLDGSHVMGANVVELEVLFKGRSSEVGLPASPQPRNSQWKVTPGRFAGQNLRFHLISGLRCIYQMGLDAYNGCHLDFFSSAVPTSMKT